MIGISIDCLVFGLSTRHSTNWPRENTENCSERKKKISWLRIPYLIISKILKISNSFLFYDDKEGINEYVEFFHNFKFG